jgi:spectinomycin phosphotransferase
MRTPPDQLDERDVVDAIATGWGFEPRGLEFLPVGAGSYHWIMTDAQQQRRFVTVDDLDQKSFLGDDRTAAFEGLQAALRTAGALRERAGLEFVVAPIETSVGARVLRIDQRYAVAVYPYMDMRPRQSGFLIESASARADVVQTLIDLHGATAVALSVAKARGFELAGRRELEAALRAVDEVWAGGPCSEPAREQFVLHAARVSRLLNTFDELVRRVRAAAPAPVITHGEPHGGNVMRTWDDRVLLVDWDTVALAPPERDLWMVASETGDELAAYTAATGRNVDPIALELYRLGWDLADLAEYTRFCRAPHHLSADTERALWAVRHLLSKFAENATPQL